MKKITKYWKKLKIRTQIILVYILILILSFALTFTFVSMVNNKYTKMEVGKAGEQTVSAVQGNLSLVFENVIQLSTYIYFDDIVQGSLKKINSKNIEMNTKEHNQKVCLIWYYREIIFQVCTFLTNMIIVTTLIGKHQEK